MREIVRRALQARPELTAELYRRGMFRREEKAEFPKQNKVSPQPLGPVQFATLLAQADAQLAAPAVLRGVLNYEELRWLDRLLGLAKRSDKREELARAVERTMEGRKGNVRSRR
ncbi:MAG: hypothetical protein ABSB82_12475 [Terriglobia bacterium]